MASGAIKGITIEFRGDTTKLGKALNDVNKEIRTTDSALREVDKALKLDPSNVELLAQKEQLLNKQIEQTREKLELQAQAAEEAAKALEEGTITQEEYAKLAAQVSTTASKLDELESSASGASGELQETGQAAEEAGDEAEDSGDKFEAWGEVVKGAAEVAVAGIAAVTAAVVATATALSDATINTASLADEILTMSSVTGVSTDTIQAMNYASELLDVSTETMTGSMTRLIRTMSNAQDGSESAIEAFDNIGVAITNADGSLRDSEDVFWDIIDSLGNMSNETERDAAAMELLGRGARELNPLIEAGSGAFEDLREEAEQTGYIMSGETLDAFGELDDNMQRMRNGATAARNAIGGILLPVLTNLSSQGVSLLNDFTNAVLDTDGDLSQLGSVIDEMVPQVIELLNEYIPILIDIGGTIIGTLASALLDNMGLILSSAGELILTIGQGIIDHLGDLAPIIADLLVQTANFIVNNLNTVLLAAIQIVIAITEGIAQAAPELIPAIVDCVLLMCQTLLGPDCLPQLIVAAQDLLMGIVEGLILATPDILASIPPLISAIIESFSQLGPMLVDNAYDWGYDMIISLINGMEESLPALASGAAGVAGTLAAYLHHTTPDKGPLKDDDKWGSDFIDNFIQGMDSEDLALERSLYGVANTIYNGMDYTSQLAGISSQLEGIGVGGIAQPINVYIGSQRVATVVANANAENNYRTGGL
jgi:phage-related minor tail protein